MSPYERVARLNKAHKLLRQFRRHAAASRIPQGHRGIVDLAKQMSGENWETLAKECGVRAPSEQTRALVIEGLIEDAAHG